MPSSFPSWTNKRLQLSLVSREISANQNKHIQKYKFANLVDCVHTVLMNLTFLGSLKMELQRKQIPLIAKGLESQIRELIPNVT